MSINAFFTNEMHLWLDAHPCDTHRLITADGPKTGFPIVGVTTNPSIVADFVQRAPQFWNRSTTEERMMEVIRAGATTLLSLHSQSRRESGWISAQISPEIMGDAGSIVEQGILYSSIAPNVMVKVPCHQEGIEAVEELVSRGISVNGTMTFYASQVKAFATAVSHGRRRLRPGSLEPKSVVTHMIGRVGDGIHPSILANIDTVQLRQFECAIGRHEQEILATVDPETTLLLSSVRMDQGHGIPIHIEAFKSTKVIFTLKPDHIHQIGAMKSNFVEGDILEGINSIRADLSLSHEAFPDIPAEILQMHLDEDALPIKHFSSTPQFAQVRSEIALNSSIHRRWNSVRQAAP
ncbi:transaldolase family protein [Rhodococcus sp. NPDC080181]|uniref:transaldolase family protein n=1 Tax=Rhodococcus sp. NPDC080181 TaxID=3155292 RepID=UPI00344F68FC